MTVKTDDRPAWATLPTGGYLRYSDVPGTTPAATTALVLPTTMADAPTVVMLAVPALPVAPFVVPAANSEPTGEGDTLAGLDLGFEFEPNIERTGPGRHRRPERLYWPLWALAALILVASAALVVVWFTTGQAPEQSFVGWIDRPMTALQPPPS